MRSRVQSDVVPNLQEARNLQEEARELESQYGPNAYSAYLRQHRRRPEKDEAAAIGSAFGADG